MTNASEVSVQALWRFPVKSMRGEPVSQVEITKEGLVGDRAYALIDVETGKVVSAKSVRIYPALLECEAAFASPPTGRFKDERGCLPDTRRSGDDV